SDDRELTTALISQNAGYGSNFRGLHRAESVITLRCIARAYLHSISAGRVYRGKVRAKNSSLGNLLGEHAMNDFEPKKNDCEQKKNDFERKIDDFELSPKILEVLERHALPGLDKHRLEQHAENIAIVYIIEWAGRLGSLIRGGEVPL